MSDSVKALLKALEAVSLEELHVKTETAYEEWITNDDDDLSARARDKERYLQLVDLTIAKERKTK